MDIGGNMQANQENNFIIVRDTREQIKWQFSNLPIRGYKQIQTIDKKLDQGDYSIVGYEDKFAIEKKSVSDLCGTLTGGHERFIREMERLKNYETSYIIIEGEFLQICLHLQKYGRLNSLTGIINSLLAYAYHYHIRVKFCKDMKTANEYAARKIVEYWELKQNKAE